MLELRPECAFCATCAEHILGDVCPNRSGGFWARHMPPEEATTRTAQVSRSDVMDL